LRKFGQAAEVKSGCVYIMASGRNGTLYIGVTSDLPKRAWEHRNGVVPGFTRKYGCKLLVWYAAFEDLQQARLRELQMKKVEAAVEAQRNRANEPGLERSVSNPW
jgi:putative endonuclease